MSFWQQVKPDVFKSYLILEGDRIVVSPVNDEQPKLVCAACAHFKKEVKGLTLHSIKQHKCNYIKEWKEARPVAEPQMLQPQVAHGVGVAVAVAVSSVHTMLFYSILGYAIIYYTVLLY